MTPSPESAKLPAHISRIDVLRAYAILMVFGVHFAVISFGLLKWNGLIRDYIQAGPYANNLGLVPLTYGWVGVTLFFVISGFCIHYAFLAQESSWRAGTFFWKRFVRLYPAYLASLVFFIIFDYLEDPSLVTTSGIITHLFLVHNLSPTEFIGINGVYWSLGVECQFYLLYPLLLWGRRKYGLPACLAASLVMNIACYSLFSQIAPNAPFHVDFYRGFPLMTWYSWILGACIAEAFVTGKPCITHAKFFLYLSLGLFLLATNFRPLIGQAFLFASVCFAVVLQEYIAVQKPLNWRERCLVPIGFVSYSLYLWHAPLLEPAQGLIHHFTGLSRSSQGVLLLVYLPLCFAAIFMLSVLSYYVFEVGARKLLTRRRATSMAPLPVASSIG